MKPLPLTPDFAAIAKRVVWYKEADETLADPVLFLCSLMTYTLPEDVITVSKYVAPAEFRRALELAPPGIFDPRSWSYWNIKCGRDPVPPLPARVIPSEVE
jgi:hypothetical protein